MKQRSTIGSRVKALRVTQQPKPTQYEVADAIGITRAHLAKIETGDDAPGRATLAALAAYFGVSMDYLETGAEAPGTQLADNFPHSPDELAWMLLGRELDEADKIAVVDFVRNTILRNNTTTRRMRR